MRGRSEIVLLCNTNIVDVISKLSNVMREDMDWVDVLLFGGVDYWFLHCGGCLTPIIYIQLTLSSPSIHYTELV